MKNAVVKIEGVRFRHNRGDSGDTLRIADFRVYEGERLFVRGASGSGKTSLLNLMTGIGRPYQGDVAVMGQPLRELSAMRRDRFRVDCFGIIFQQFNLLPFLSVLENALLPCRFSKKRRLSAGGSPSALRRTAERLLKELAIPEALFYRPAGKLSVGQQQRVAAARALIGRPKIIAADEPTSSLDADNADRFLDLLFSEADKQNSTVVFVSHDPRLAPRFSRAVEMSSVNSAKPAS